MRILLVDSYSAAHVGNAALLECSLEVLREAFPGATFEVLAKDPESLKGLCGCACHSYLFPDLLSPGRRSGLRALLWAAKNLAWAAVDALNLGLGLGISPLAYSFDARRREAIRALLEADLVAGIGGEMLNARFRRVTPFLLHGYWTAKRLGKRVVLFPQSIGPLGNGWFMRLSRLALKNCDLIMARDRGSVAEAERLGLSPPRLLFVPDVALLQKQATREAALALLRAEGWDAAGAGPTLGLTVCADARDAFEALRAVCEYVVRECNGRVVLLIANHPEDVVSSETLVDSLPEKTRIRVFLLRKSYRPAEFKAIAGTFDVFVSTRMHAAILATMAPVPTIAIGTQPKVRGYMELIGQEAFCFDSAEVRKDTLREAVEHCLGRREDVCQELLEAQADLAPKVRAAGQAVRSLFGQDERKGLYDTVVAEGYCIGCGACAHASDGSVHMEMDGWARLQPVGTTGDLAAAVCPFSAEVLDEDVLAASILGGGTKRSGEIGQYRGLYAAHVKDPAGRARGSSGGVATWILTRLLESGEVDGVLHVRPRDGERLFAYSVSRTVEELRAGAKSHYYPVELSEVLRHAVETPGRYALVGLPCFIKAVRLLMRRDAVLAQRIVCCVGLVCGHMKSAAYAQCLAWQCGVEPGALRRVDFRVKRTGYRADDYGFEANGVVRPSRELFGADWGLNFFSYGACEACDDVFAETADISIGDAWLRRFTRDGLGVNVVVTRSEAMERLIAEGVRDGEIEATPLTEGDTARSQRGGLFNRREALAWRMHVAQHEGRWHPPKRVRADGKALSRRERKKHALRMMLAEKSREAFRAAVVAGDFEVFRREMAPWVARYRKVARPWWRRVLRRRG